MPRRFESLRRFASMVGLCPRLLYHLCACRGDIAYGEFLRWLPDDPGIWKRRKYYRKRLQACGENLIVLQGVWMFCPEKIGLGNDVTIAGDVKINAGGGLTAGDDVLIGPDTKIWTQNHRFDDPTKPIPEQGWTYKPVIIGNDVWVAAHCVILPGVIIGDHAVVGAGSVVTKAVPEWAVVAGNPAKIVKYRTSETSCKADMGVPGTATGMRHA